MSTLVGKVGMVTKGTWNSSATYEKLDVVYYEGATYIAKYNVPANTLPTNTSYWQLAVSTGYPKTAVGVTAASGFTIDSNKSYRIGDVVYLVLYITTSTAVASRTKCATINSSDAFPPAVVRYIGAAAPLAGSESSLVNTGYISTSGDIYIGDNAANAKTFSIVLSYVV